MVGAAQGTGGEGQVAVIEWKLKPFQPQPPPGSRATPNGMVDTHDYVENAVLARLSSRRGSLLPSRYRRPRFSAFPGRLTGC